MSKRWTVCAMVFLFLSGAALAGQGSMENSGTWSGVIVNSGCTVDEAFAETPKCTENAPGASVALYDDTIRKIFSLDPQDQARGQLGMSVTVKGTLDRGTIHVASLEPLTAIGLPVGAKAPAFEARDQFGKVQTLDTLKGPNGTVLLFFRSADW